MNQLRNVLVATDYSAAARAALAHGKRLANASNAALHVVSVLDAEPGPESMLPTSADELLRKEVENALPGCNPDSVRMVIGRPAREILAEADRVSADILCIGVNGQSQHAGIGTVASRCVRKSRVKTLIVPSGSITPSYKRVLACVDLSELTPLVLNQSCRAAALDNGDVTAIHVFQPEWERAQWIGQPTDPSEAEVDYRRGLGAEVRRAVENAKLGDAEKRVRIELVHAADMAKGVVDYAAKENTDLIVLGTTGRTALGYLLLGTTAEKVIRDAGRAVLAVKS